MADDSQRADGELHNFSSHRYSVSLATNEAVDEQIFKQRRGVHRSSHSTRTFIDVSGHSEHNRSHLLWWRQQRKYYDPTQWSNEQIQLFNRVIRRKSSDVSRWRNEPAVFLRKVWNMQNLMESQERPSSDFATLAQPSDGELKPHLRRSKLKWDAPINLRGSEILACPDTGSEQNILSNDIAGELGVLDQIDPSRSCKFILANGKASWSLGTIELEMCFSKQPEILFTCIFHVFESLIRPVILGGVFLRNSDTLTKHRHSRLRRRFEPISGYPTVLHIGYARERFRCYVDSVMVDTHADTGSEMDLVSSKFVQKSTQRAKALETPMAVQFADGTFGEISHHIFTRFSADLERPKSEWEGKWFYVLDDLPCEVLLGDDTLDMLDAFNRETSFVMEVLDPEGIQLCTIFWAHHLDQKASKLWNKFSVLDLEKHKRSADDSVHQDQEPSVAFDDPLLANVDAEFRNWVNDMISGGKGLTSALQPKDRIDMQLLDALDSWESNRRSKLASTPSYSEDSIETDRRKSYDASRGIVLHALSRIQARPVAADSIRCTNTDRSAAPVATQELLANQIDLSHSNPRRKRRFLPLDMLPWATPRRIGNYNDV
ncbi:hypothetical protein LTR84_008347 [Exophiala bonariae]|uniref:Uncharacterized protein n=1 Tax=Exophiala bonariae TaxID=1690606 RepID=A0AAV9MYI7_9EURO|nr:hypothetical protein LTR84_008347 [Exophiala bonariae]